MILLFVCFGCYSLTSFTQKELESLQGKKIKPDIIFKGSDYKLKNIIGYDFKMEREKKIETIKLAGNISTTKIIKKLQK